MILLLIVNMFPLLIVNVFLLSVVNMFPLLIVNVFLLSVVNKGGEVVTRGCWEGL